MDWGTLYIRIHAIRIHRTITFRKARASGSGVVYDPDKRVEAGVEYRSQAWDEERGVLYPSDDVRLQIWLRDWFGRSTDGASNTELAQMLSDWRGQAKEDSSEFYSRFLVDGQELKYRSHTFEQRPDGVIFAAVVTVGAS